MEALRPAAVGVEVPRRHAPSFVRGAWPTIGLLMALASCAWIALLAPAASRPASPMHPHTQPLSATGFATTWLMWMVMMAAMMLPTVVPWIMAFHDVDRAAIPDQPRFGSVLFGLGYLAAWSLFSLVATIGDLVVLQHGVFGGAVEGLGSALGAVLLVGAGMYQLSPRRAACLRRCRSPLSFFLTSWQSGYSGAWRMGLLHGRDCVTCCWALMLVSFALGVMNLLWMGALTLLICLERMTRNGPVLGRILGVGLMCWGLAVLIW